MTRNQGGYTIVVSGVVRTRPAFVGEWPGPRAGEEAETERRQRVRGIQPGALPTPWHA